MTASLEHRIMLAERVARAAAVLFGPADGFKMAEIDELEELVAATRAWEACVEELERGSRGEGRG